MQNVKIFALVLVLALGCCTKEVRQSQPQTEPAPAKTEAPAPAVRYTSTNCMDPCSLIRLTTQAANDANIGQPYETDATLTALADACNIVVIGKTPEGATYLKSEPNASVEGSKLTWAFESLKKDTVVPIKVWFRADREGQLVCCFTMTAMPGWCVVTQVGRAALTIVKIGPATANLNSSVTYTIRVTNSGNAVAREVVVTDELPEGLTHESGQRTLTFPAFDLEAGATRELTVTVTAAQRGRFCNVARAASPNAGTVNAEACTVVQQENLNLTVTCEKEQFVGKPAKSTIVLTNPGDVALTNVVVTATFPEQLKMLSSDCGFEKTDTGAVWNVGELAPNAEKNCGIAVISKYAGEHCIKVSVNTGEGINKSESCCTSWKGFAALLIEVVDDPDPLLANEETTYTIRITNQGTADDQNITIRGTIPEELEGVSLTGATTGTIDGKNVTLTPYPVLAPKQAIEWKLVCKAVKAGDARMKFYLTSELLKTPVIEEESTHVY